MKRKNHIYYGFCVFTLIIVSALSQGGLIVVPTNPTTADSVSIQFLTWLGNPGVIVTGYDQSVYGYDIYLDLFTYQQPGIWPDIIIDISQTYSIGNLPAGIYQVQARQYDLSISPIPYYTESTNFEVLPEPATLMLLALGGLALNKRK